jgi:DNA modification methylase
MIENRKTADLPLAVWPCAQRTSQWQRYGRYLAESNRHPDKMLSALTRRAVETYSKPGALVVDPMCGIGSTLVEAIDLGPRAIGVELEPRWAKLAAANVEHAYEDQRTRSLAQVTARVPQASDRGQRKRGPSRHGRQLDDACCCG